MSTQTNALPAFLNKPADWAPGFPRSVRRDPPGFSVPEEAKMELANSATEPRRLIRPPSKGREHVMQLEAIVERHDILQDQLDHANRQVERLEQENEMLRSRAQIAGAERDTYMRLWTQLCTRMVTMQQIITTSIQEARQQVNTNKSEESAEDEEQRLRELGTTIGNNDTIGQ